MAQQVATIDLDGTVDIGKLEFRREAVFLILAGTFLGAMTMLNIIGITRFIQIGPLTLAVGVLPYPLTFFCTDLIGEFYGKRRANLVVWVGLFLNLFVISVMWLGQALPAVPAEMQPPWQVMKLASPIALPNGAVLENESEFFDILYACSAGSVLASMIAYMAAQFCDVYVFHFFKDLTKGKHLWLRNNGSTMASQLVDSIMVISITFGAAFLDGKMSFMALLTLVGSSYLFKFVAAALDTIPIYWISGYLKNYLQVDPKAVR